MQDSRRDEAQQEYLFALDIGTRSVIGVVGRMEDGIFNVLGTEREEHAKRAMFDGQIEDIAQVAKIAGLVKERLEQRLDTTFSNVCVAAAGRALRTSRAQFALELNPEEPISSQMVYQLEMGAIGLAQDEVNGREADEEKSMFCVGYSVINYRLDDYPMTTVLGHKGHSAQVEVIATFLPNQVVDSLRSAMSLIDLNIINLTLEPIAAMNAVIPTELRLLNLALCDIGAGTSDIAISDKGSVVAYTMATTAGDEITESVMKRFLVDFGTAENLKAMAARGDDPIYYTDILGFDYVISLEELLDILRPAVEALAEEICKRITEGNGGGPPVAVFLVGGGSKIPLLGEAVARLLDIDIKKVAVGGSNYMKKQTKGDMDISDPEFATPLGIAITAASYAEQNSMCVYVNDQKVYMLRSTGFTVMNALLMCGYKYAQLMGKSGKSLSFSINGENMLIRGGLPQPAEITVNDLPASIATAVERDDRIIIMPSLSGNDVHSEIGAFMKTHTEQRVTVDGIPYAIGELPLVNGVQVSQSYAIEDGDAIETVWVHSLAELCRRERIPTEGRHFTINDRPALLTDLLRDGDRVLSEDDSYEFRPVTAVNTEEEAEPVEPMKPEPKPAPMPEPAPPPPVKQPTGKPIHVTINRRTVELYPKEDDTVYQFIDMLNFVDIDPTKPEGDIILRLNGKNASYLQEVRDGDTVQIYWSQREDEFTL